MEYKVNDKIFIEILNYLAKKPLEETYHLFTACIQLKEKQDKEASIEKEKG